MITALEKLCEVNNLEEKTKQDILKITRAIVEQDTIYVQNEGLAMGAPTSSVFFRNLPAKPREYQNRRTVVKTQG